MKENKESIFEQIAEFLEYLGKNGYNKKTREKTNLIEKFGEKKFENVFDFCFSSRFVGYGLPRVNIDTIHITPEGIKFLEEHKKERMQENHNRTISSLTSILALTGTVTLIKNIWDEPGVLLIIYIFLIIISVIYFRRAKNPMI